MDKETYDSIFAIIRVIGRIGFVFLLVNFYRVYRIFASPLFKNRSRIFIRFFAGAVVLGFILMLIEFFTDNSIMPLITVGFNTITTYVLVFYLGRHVDELESKKGSAEYVKYTLAMDNFIKTLKQPQRR